MAEPNPNYYEDLVKRTDAGEFNEEPTPTANQPQERADPFFKNLVDKADSDMGALKGHAADYAKFLVENTDNVPHERAKEIFTLSRISGYPMDYVRDNFDDVKKDHQYNDWNWGEIQKKSPALVEYMQNPDNVFLIKDDVQKMSDWEAWVGRWAVNPEMAAAAMNGSMGMASFLFDYYKQERQADFDAWQEEYALREEHRTGERKTTPARKVVLAPLSLAPLFEEEPGLIHKAWERGSKQSEFSYRAYGFMSRSEPIPYDRDTVDYMMSTTDLGEQDRGLGLRIMAGAAETLPAQIHSLLAGAVAAKGTSILTAPLGPEIQGPATAIAAGVGAFEVMNMLEGGSAYWQYQQEAANRGVKFDPAVASIYASNAGVLNGLTELVPEALFLKPFLKIPEFKKFFSTALKEAATEGGAAANAALKDAFPAVSMKKAFAKTLLEFEFAHQFESGVEAEQQIVTDIEQENAIAAMGGPTTFSYIPKDAMDAYKGAWLSFIPMMLAGSGGVMRSEWTRKRTAQANAASLFTTAVHIQGLKTGQTSPEEMMTLAQKMQEQHDLPSTLFFKRSTWDETFSNIKLADGRKLDPRQAAREMTGSDDAYDQAVAQDADVAIPYSAWVARIAPSSELIAKLTPDMRLHAGDSYLSDYIGGSPEIEAMAEEPVESYDEGRAQLYATLRGLIPEHKNITEEQADHAAKVWTAQVTKFAQSAGYEDPMQYWTDRNYELSIASGTPSAATNAALNQAGRLSGQDLEDSVDALAQTIRDSHPDLAQFEANVAPGGDLHLANIRVKDEAKGKGTGSAAVRDLLKFADDNGMFVSLTPQADPGKKGALERFYRKLGFEPRHGGRQGYAPWTSGTWVRFPKNKAKLLQRAHWDTPEFREWFEGSKVVDEQGKPLVIYHGSADEFNTFVANPNDGLIWASTSPFNAAVFGQRYGKPNIKPLYARITNPIVIDYEGAMFGGHADMEARAITVAMKEGKLPTRNGVPVLPQGPVTADTYKGWGYDGLILNNVKNYEDFYYDETAPKIGYGERAPDAELVSTSYVVFDPNQFKSAIGNRGTYEPEQSNILYQRAARAEGEQADSLLNWEPERTSDGKLRGVPEHVNAKKSPGARTAAWRQIEDVFRGLAAEGASARYWYENSAREILNYVGGDVVKAEKLIQLLAIYSPQRPVWTNAMFALRAYNHWATGGSEETSPKPNTNDQRKKANAVLYHDEAFKGRKTNSFYANLMHEVWQGASPAERASLKIPADVMEQINPPVTIDVWMLRAAGYGRDVAAGDVAGTGRYSTMEKLVGKITAELNDALPEGAPRWIPHQVQAAIWSAIKARREIREVKARTNAESLKKGYSKMGLTKKGRPKIVNPTSGPNLVAHSALWLKHALAASETDTAKQMVSARRDFGDAIRAQRDVVEAFSEHINEPLTLAQRVWQGSPADELQGGRWMDSFVGTGENTQGQGFGHYFSSKKSVAEWYRRNLAEGSSKTFFVESDRVRNLLATYPELTNGALAHAKHIMQYHGSPLSAIHALEGNILVAQNRINASEMLSDDDEALLGGRLSNKMLSGLRQLIQQYELGIDLIKNGDLKLQKKVPGNVFEAEIPEDSNLLHWSTSVEKQPPEVLERLKSSGILKRVIDWNVKKIHANYPSTPHYDIEQLVLANDASHLYFDLATALGPVSISRTGVTTVIDQEDANAGASQALREAGIPGHVYQSNSGNQNYVIFDPGVIQHVSNLYQDAMNGFISFTPGGRRFDITLLDGADISTLMHEMSHFFVNVMGDEATREPATQQQRDDYNKLIKWMGYDSHQQRIAEQKEAAKLAAKEEPTKEESERLVELTAKEEKLARGLERYLYDGRPPSVELGRSFTLMRAWLTKVYRYASRLGVELDDEIRGVFDRMFAADDAIAQAEARNPFVPDEEARAAMTDAERAQYDEASVKAVTDPQDELRARLIRDQKDALTSWFKREREQIKDEVTERLGNRGDYRAMRFLQTGKMPEGVEVPSSFLGDDGKPMKLNKASLAAALEGGFMKTAQRLRIYQAEGGIDAEFAAGLLGFGTAKEMVRQFSMLTQFAQAVEADTEKEIQDRYPDLLKDQAALADQAALVNLSDARAEQLMINIRVLARMAGKTDKVDRVPVNAKKMAEAAQQQMESRQAGQFSPHTYFTRMTAAGREAVNMKTPAKRWDARVKQLWNLHLYRAAVKAQQEYEKSRRTLQKATEPPFQKKVGLAGHGLLDMVNEILRRISFKRESGVETQRRIDLRASVKELDDAGLDWIIPESILDQAQNKSYREMTLKEIREAATSVINIGHLAREWNGIVKADKTRVMKDEVIPSLLATLQANLPIVELQDHDPNKVVPFQGTRSFADTFKASLLKIEELIRRMDGNQVNGPWAQFVWNPVVQAEADERDMTLAVTELLLKEIEKLPEMQRQRLNGTDKFVSKITGKEYTYLFALSVALNTGNAMNLERLINPTRTDPKWSIEAVNEVLDHLTVEDMHFVQGVWNVLETMWPKIAALEERLSGVPPPKVDRQAFSFKGARFEGGYFPLKYARNESRVARLDVGSATATLFDHNYARAMTNHGHVQARVQSFGDPLDLSINVIPAHIQSVIHDLTHREALLSIHKILNEGDLRFEMLQRLGSEKTAQFDDWLRGLANDQNQDINALKGVAAITRGARRNLSMYAMGMKATMFFQNFANIFSAMDQVKARYLAQGSKEFYENRQEMVAFIKGKSGEMRHRFNAVERDVRDLLMGQLAGTTSAKVKTKVARFSSYATSVSDAAVAFPVWLGAYRQGLEEQMSEEDAVAFADRSVRLTLGGAGQKDLANIQRNKEALKWLTMFYSFFSTQYNQLARITWDTKVSARDKSLADDWPRLAGRTIATIAAQALIAEYLSGRGPDDDEPWWKWILRKATLFPLQTIPIVREGATYLEAFAAGREPRDIRFGQIAPITQDISDALIANYKWLAEDNEFDKQLVKRDLRAIGMTLGLPLAQPVITGEYVWDLANGDEDPDTFWELGRNLMFTRRRK